MHIRQRVAWVAMVALLLVALSALWWLRHNPGGGAPPDAMFLKEARHATVAYAISPAGRLIAGAFHVRA